MASCSAPWPAFALVILAPVLVSVLVYQLESFDPGVLPIHELTQPLEAPKKNSRMLQGAEFVGVGKLNAPEDIAYDSESGFMYTGCVDGWIKRVTVNESVADMVVKDWVNTGGRALGLVLGRQHHELIVADAYKGLLNISSDGRVELLTDEAEGLNFKLTDGVDIADDGTIYFTDASYKYNFHDAILDLLEGKPYGRLMSFDPKTKETKVLVRDLYFANGVALSPHQDYVVFCETPLRMCRKYYIKGEKQGSVEKFIHGLPGSPDNIHYDGRGHYWIALAIGMTNSWEVALRYPALRKVMAIVMKYIGRERTMTWKDSGVFVVDLDGKPVAHYHDPALKLISSGVKIGSHVYCGSIIYPYIIRFDVAENSAGATATA